MLLYEISLVALASSMVALNASGTTGYHGLFGDILISVQRFDDASRVKKTRFLQIYQKASQEGLSVANIKSGWKASGVYPWNPRHAIRSSLVLKDAVIAQITPRTPPSRKRNALESDVYLSPSNRRNFDSSVHRATHQETLSRSFRTFLNKTSRQLDRLQWENRQKDDQIASLKTQLERSKAQRQKGKAIDANQTFASIESI
ncbi:hypothetical protein CLAIMM_00635 isoform 2 [Cladophialophora immunda]|nr:hypothetical protein CLAIMM_00635 isoform 2 [Cladophialophora immunda]